jgi:anti-anti-sigma factor
MDHSLEIKNTKAGQEVVLSLSGGLTIAEAHETKEVLLGAIGQSDTLRLDLAGVDAVDISFLQILCAAHRECLLSGKDIVLQGVVTDTLKDFLDRAGYNKPCGCFSGAKESCLYCTANTGR